MKWSEALRHVLVDFISGNFSTAYDSSILLTVCRCSTLLGNQSIRLKY